MVVRKKATSTITLPLDIVHIILEILPVKSLKRFKTVCKSWNAIISDHDFVKSHLRQSKNSTNQNILMRYSCVLLDGGLRLVKFENSLLQVETIKEHRNLYPGDLLCYSDDGLLLLSITCSTSYLLWNPSSKQQAIIPCPQNIFIELPRTTFGFCRGPTLDDYKIIARCHKHYVVYSCKNKVWNEEKEFPYASTNMIRIRGVFVDGFSFFVMVESGTSNLTKIIYFDPRDETFNMLHKPREMLEDSRNFFLTSLRGCLCLYNHTYGEDRLEVWMMKDHITVDSNSWTKCFIFDYKRPISTRRSTRLTPLFLTEKNELVMLSHGQESEFGIYSSMNEKYEKLDVSRSKEIIRYSETIPYVDSLFFPITYDNARDKIEERV